MAYSELEARSLVIEAGLELVKKKLIARTWGNISARISDTQFVITPSGRAYEDLKPEDLVVVNIEDCSYTGNVKPSSEKGIHANIYALRKDADFVIHTHQHYASAVCVNGKDTEFAPCAAYGLPGTKKLKKAVSKVVKNNPDKNMFLMHRHGAVVFGKTYDEAFKFADLLESKCKELFKKGKREVSKRKTLKPYLDDYAQIMGFSKKDPSNEDKLALEIIKAKNRDAAMFARTSAMSFFDIWLQHSVYKLKYSKLKNKR